jgi:hypothetical protein
VYDVRDLCRDEHESAALADAIISQTESDSWDQFGGPASLQFAKPGTMVVRNQERVLMAVLDLLESYRAALRASRPRKRDVVDAMEVITVYYRMHANVAEDLADRLKTLVQPDSWKGEARPDAPGEVIRVASSPELSAAGSGVKSADRSADAHTLVIARAVLIITQSRDAHDEIADVIRRVESGDPPAGLKSMGGMGGFGGGFFSVPSGHDGEHR